MCPNVHSSGFEAWSPGFEVGLQQSCLIAFASQNRAASHMCLWAWPRSGTAWSWRVLSCHSYTATSRPWPRTLLVMDVTTVLHVATVTYVTYVTTVMVTTTVSCITRSPEKPSRCILGAMGSNLGPAPSLTQGQIQSWWSCGAHGPGCNPPTLQLPRLSSESSFLCPQCYPPPSRCTLTSFRAFLSVHFYPPRLLSFSLHLLYSDVLFYLANDVSR
jgi:hypothetical protein